MTTTRTLTVDQLTAGDIVTAINGKPRPFPHHVVSVTNCRYGKDTYTTVKYAHGGGELPTCPASRIVATVVVDG